MFVSHLQQILKRFALFIFCKNSKLGSGYEALGSWAAPSASHGVLELMSFIGVNVEIMAIT